MKRVVVVMSTYNGGKYLPPQIDSILSQKGIMVHLYIRDDGSTDETISILKRYENFENVTVEYGTNIGWKKSFILALMHAPEGDYYAFSDQDDYWLDEKLLSAVTQLDDLSNEKPVVYVSNAWITDEKLNKKRKYNATYTNESFLEYLSPYKAWAHIDIPGGCAQVFNGVAKDLALEIRDYPFGHDNLIERLCAFMGAVVYDAEPFLLYRQHSNNTIGANVTMRKRWRRLGEILLKKDNKIRACAARSFLDCYSKYLNEEQRDFLKLCATAHYDLTSRFRLIAWRGFEKSSFRQTIALKIKILINVY